MVGKLSRLYANTYTKKKKQRKEIVLLIRYKRKKSVQYFEILLFSLQEPNIRFNPYWPIPTSFKQPGPVSFLFLHQEIFFQLCLLTNRRYGAANVLFQYQARLKLHFLQRKRNVPLNIHTSSCLFTYLFLLFKNN